MSSFYYFQQQHHQHQNMRLKRIFRIASWHVALYCFVVLYILAGASVFHYLEGERETVRHIEQTKRIQELKAQLFREIAHRPRDNPLHISLDNYLLFDSSAAAMSGTYNPASQMPSSTSTVGDNSHKRWTFPSSVLFSFTILTTIGYGNVAPTTTSCQIFTMVYGAFGIPLFLITIADVGRFFKTFIMSAIQLCFKRELKKRGEPKLSREIGEVILVAVLFLTFIALGSAVLPLWEHQLTYFESVYFSYMSLTTIGLGDIVPRRMDFLLPTLIYITLGLWLTTALVEQLADVFRLVHYAGRHVSNVKGITTVCRRVGMSDNVVGQINWDRTIDRALKGEQPPLVPIFPWHFADFLEHDPPLIDLSVDDIPQLSGAKDEDAYFYSTKPSRTITCTSPKHNGMCGDGIFQHQPWKGTVSTTPSIIILVLHPLKKPALAARITRRWLRKKQSASSYTSNIRIYLPVSNGAPGRTDNDQKTFVQSNGRLTNNNIFQYP
uniref:Potassium channel domain-containing protein n=1 Tax=Ditylenchus dipsaci TaxID=166011 RepID=A0A915DHG4_9BILA